MNETNTIKVLIVDDHPVVRTGLTTMLYPFDDIDLIGEAGSGPEALERCQENIPDVILMDIVMPDMDGLATARAVLARHPTVKIIMLTTFPEPDLVEKAMDSGATGYMVKNTPIDALADAIRAAHAGHSSFAPEVTQAMLRTRTRGPKPGHDLSEREREVLALVVEGLTNREIAGRLSISPATVRHHVSSCISKLGAANRAQAAALAVEHQLTSQ
jgi:NarL family two-component system response regulator LiaR